jgi:hypothetical protein
MSPETFYDTLAIKRSDDSSSLDNIFGYNASDVESEKEVMTSSTVDMDKINSHMRKFEQALDSGARRYDCIDNYHTLMPNEINLLFSSITNKGSNHFSFPWALGEFFSNIIQKSYCGGNNDFILNTASYPGVDNLCGKICGTKERPIKISIKGDVNNYFASLSKYLDVSLDGNVGYESFQEAKDINLKLKGNLGKDFGYNSKNINILVGGNVDWGFGSHSKNIAAFIKGDVGQNFGSRSINLTATILGNAKVYFGNGSDNFDAVIKGHVEGPFLSKCNNYLALVGEGIKGWNYVDQSQTLILNDEAKFNPTYIARINEIHKRLKEW